ncbi:filamentous hemagglutinin N-terminal domain-containing protein [Brasilonema sp. CT11]|nr:filamentous hemagglutinin N-terminal domain-containing protein [Brasilonema sp. CT11]
MLSKLQVSHPFFFLTLPLATLASLSYFTVARAQITPDNSLGAERSVVTPNVQINGTPSDKIDGGATRGANLFHSFQEFNVSAGRGAYFSNPAGIANILTRVTGGNISNIQGVLGVLGKANLFFINPNGIIFGPNARLDLRGGSFLGSTANSLIFKNGFEFSATNPQAPPLLTINIPIGLRFRDNPGNITSQSTNLEVPQGNSLVLVGGNVSLDSGQLNAFGGRVELGGLAGTGTVELQADGNNFSLGFPDNLTRANVSLTNKANVRVDAGGGGSIAVNARNLDISGGSTLRAGIGQALGSVGSQAGDITISSSSFSLTGGAQLINSTFGQGNAGSVSVRASNSVELAGSNTAILSTVEPGGVGNSGNIDIKGATFSLKDGAQLLTSVRQASSTQPAGTGDAGKININAASVSLKNGAALSTSTYGQGNAGDIAVRADNSVELVNANIFSNVESGGVGNGGNININAASLSLKDGAQLQTLVRGASNNQPAGTGDAGKININAVSVSLNNGAALFTSTYGQGNAGDIAVRADNSVELVNANILSNVESGGIGNGGNININAASLSLKDGAQLETLVREKSDTQPAGRGDAGKITVDVTGLVTIAGIKDEFRSGIHSEVQTGATGNGGDITISSGSFSLTDGARLTTSSYGQGNAGNIALRADNSVEFVNGDIFSNVEAGGVGNGGNININAASFSLKDSAQLQTLVREKSDTQPAGRGDAGKITVDVTGKATIIGIKDGLSSGIFSQINPGATGNGGNITLSSGSFSLTDGAKVSASTFGQGDAGDIAVRASDSVELVNANIFSNVEPGGVGKAGNININAATLSLKDGAQLGTAVRQASSNQLAGRRDAGNVTVDVTGKVTIAGFNNQFPSGIFSRVEPGARGNGGDITISSGSFSLTDGGNLDANTFGQGNAGNITVRADNSVELAGSNTYIFSAVGSEAVGNGGNININAASVSLKDGAQIFGSSFGNGTAGNIEPI